MMTLCLIILAVSAHICLYKVIWAENTGVRIAAADAIGIMVVVILVLLSAYLNAPYLVDVAIVYALLLFVDVLALAKFFEKGLMHK